MRNYTMTNRYCAEFHHLVEEEKTYLLNREELHTLDIALKRGFYLESDTADQNRILPKQCGGK